jgi:hypothetical protein
MHKALVNLTVACGEHSRSIVAGQLYDLSERVTPAGATLAELVDPSHFVEMVPASPAPVTSKKQAAAAAAAQE